MAILKAEVLAKVNKRLSRSETDIDDEIEAVLNDISKRADFLTKEATRETEKSIDYYAVPENFKDMTDIRVNDDEEPLERKSHNYFLKVSAGDNSENTPTIYAVQNDFFWLHPCPNKVYTMTLYYSIFHPKDADNIEFGEEFREAVNEGTMAKVSENYEDWESVKAHMALCEAEIKKLTATIKRPIRHTKYNDL